MPVSAAEAMPKAVFQRSSIIYDIFIMVAAAWWDTLFVGLTLPPQSMGPDEVRDVGTFPVQVRILSATSLA